MMLQRSPAFFALVLLTYLMSFSVVAQPPLPPVPQQNIVDSVVVTTGGAVFTPLNALTNVVDNLFAFLGGVTSALLDPAQTVHYIDAKGTLRESVTPVKNLLGLPLAPVLPLPGLPLRFGQVIGIDYQPATGPTWVVVTFKLLNNTPQSVRFYSSLNSYIEKPVYVGQFTDPDGDHKVSLIDSGAVMTQQRTCITVGLKQVCWEPDKAARKPGPAKKAIKQALVNLHAVYSFTATFDHKNAVPDILGKSRRQACAAFLDTATTFTKMADCKPDIFIAASTDNAPGAPIAVMVVRRSVDIRTFDASGNPVGALPAGDYLVMATPVASSAPGTPTALFLIGADGSTYLIASTVLEGLSTGSQTDTRAAGIKDGFTRYRAFGW